MKSHLNAFTFQVEQGHGIGHAENRGARWNSKPKKSGKSGNLQYSKWETKAEERNKDFSGTVYMLCSHARRVEVEEEAD